MDYEENGPIVAHPNKFHGKYQTHNVTSEVTLLTDQVANLQARIAALDARTANLEVAAAALHGHTTAFPTIFKELHECILQIVNQRQLRCVKKMN